MKKKIIIGMAVIGASVAVLGGCGGSVGSDTTATTATTAITNEITTETTTETNTTSETKSQETVTTSDVSVELDEAKRAKFDVETGLYSVLVEDSAIDFHYPEDWEVDISNQFKKGISTSEAKVANDVTIRIFYDDEIIGDGTINALKERFNEDIVSQNLKEPKVAETTVDGTPAIFTQNKGETQSDYRYEVPLTTGSLTVMLKCPTNDIDIDKYIKSLEMVAESVDIPSEFKPQ